MATTCSTRASIQGHPCFGGDHHRNGRIHLPVAPRCTIRCRYCSRRHDCANESRPGVTSRILTPVDALARLRETMANPLLGPVIRVVGIAGPGDPLANTETFETFGLVQQEFPHLIGCLSTNGLLLPESVDGLAKLGVGSITVTVNSIDPAVGANIYSHVSYGGFVYRGVEAAAILVGRQFEGIRRAVSCGIAVKVNTVVIPGINDGEVRQIAIAARNLGVSIMNVMPLIPQADFARVAPPSRSYVDEIRTSCSGIVDQQRHCRQCRADAIGLVGEEGGAP